jgi:type II secretory pathway pseudopilin PulG
MFYYSVRRYRRGFSLLEALFAVVVLFMGMAFFMNMLPYAMQKNQHDSYYLQSVAAGQEYLDALRASIENGGPKPAPPTVPIDAGGSVVGNGLNQSPGNFAISGGCTQVGSLQSLYDCIVTVSWSEYGQPRTYVVESYATQQVS